MATRMIKARITPYTMETIGISRTMCTLIEVQAYQKGNRAMAASEFRQHVKLPGGFDTLRYRGNPKAMPSE